MYDNHSYNDARGNPHKTRVWTLLKKSSRYVRYRNVSCYCGQVEQSYTSVRNPKAVIWRVRKKKKFIYPAEYSSTGLFPCRLCFQMYLSPERNYILICSFKRRLWITRIYDGTNQSQRFIDLYFVGSQSNGVIKWKHWIIYTTFIYSGYTQTVQFFRSQSA